MRFVEYLMGRVESLWLQSQHTPHNGGVWSPGNGMASSSPYPGAWMTASPVASSSPITPPYLPPTTPTRAAESRRTPDAPSCLPLPAPPPSCSATALFAGPVHPEFFRFQSKLHSESLSAYVGRIVQYCDLAPCSIVRALYCVNTFRKRQPAIPITPFTVYRILLAA